MAFPFAIHANLVPMAQAVCSKVASAVFDVAVAVAGF